ncbi:hypothetical protein Btru_061121 [Bulinus truncatus]|nr:hypothetical protein Btru_061121 [Bulinus truncatus]
MADRVKQPKPGENFNSAMESSTNTEGQSTNEVGCSLVSKQIPGDLSNEKLSKDYPSFSDRHKSFQDSARISIPDPKYLARHGFVFTGPPNSVQCCGCGVRLRFYPTGDGFIKAHRKTSPSCPFLPENLNDLDQQEQHTDDTETPESHNALGFQLKSASAEPQNSNQVVNEADDQTMRQTCVTVLDPAEIDDMMKCKLCGHHRRSLVLLPCLHVITCKNCGQLLRECYTCQEPIDSSREVVLEN